MQENPRSEQGGQIYARVLRAGKRTYFFDVRSTRAGDYYLTITESKKVEGEGYQKHKIYLYKEDFGFFKELLDDVTEYIVASKGHTVISETHDPDFKQTQGHPPAVNGVSLEFEDL